MAAPKVNIALVDTTSKISLEELQRVANALQIQVSRDFAPVWDKDATVHVFDHMTDIPLGFWPISIVSAIDVQGVNGYHWIDDEGNPFAKVEYRDDFWPLTVSHELLEMLVNPYVNKIKLVKGLDDTGQEVEFLVEVADPVEDNDFGYRIDGVLLSNFYYPAFFDLTKREGVKYDHLGWLKEPRKLLNGGYISWKNASGEWWQAFMVENKLIIRKLGDSTPLTTADHTIILGWTAVATVSLIALTFLIKLFKRNGNRIR